MLIDVFFAGFRGRKHKSALLTIRLDGAYPKQWQLKFEQLAIGCYASGAAWHV
jgi:hypothetical protein